MITEFENFLNEKVLIPDETRILKELDGAKFLNVEYINNDEGWGITYSKNGKTGSIGGFNFNEDVHEFLISHNIDYSGRSGYEYMRKHRADQKKIPFDRYQKDLMLNGIPDDMLEDF
jgi:hypothetical protein